GVLKCGLCEGTGINEAKTGRNPMVAAQVVRLRGELRQGFAKIEDLNLQVTDRVTLLDGRSLQGMILRRMSDGIILATWAPSTRDIQVLAVQSKQGYRVTHVSSLPPATAAPNGAKQAPATTPAPSSGTDTVVLKDGTSVSGKIVAKSDELLMV